MKIWWQNSAPVHATKECAGFIDALSQHLNAIKRSDTKIAFNSVDHGSLDLDFNATVALNTFGPGGFLNKLIEAERQQYDAIAVGCFLDPALDEARELIDIPIFGLAETAMHVACTMGAKFSGIAFSEKHAQFLNGLVRKYGLESRAVPFTSLGMGLDRLFGEGYSDASQILDLVRKSVKQLTDAGAEVILPACSAIGMLLVKEKISEMDGALILDVNALLLKNVEAMVEYHTLTGIKTRSRKLLYKKPSQDKMDKILEIYQFK